MQTANSKSRATIAGLRAYWELVDQFLNLHVFIPDPSYGEVPEEIETFIGVSHTQKHFSV